MKKIFWSIFLVVLLAIGFAFLFLPSIADNKMNPVYEHDVYPISEEAQALHDSLIVGDWHADTMLWSRDIGERHSHGHVDIPRLQAGNVGLQMFTTVTKSPSGLNYAHNSADARDDITLVSLFQLWPIKTWNSLTERALYQAQKLHRYAERNADDLMVIRNQSDLANWQKARRTNKHLIGGLIGTEGNHALDGKLENVQRLYDAGFRMMSLHHFFDNQLGGSLHGVSNAGLTPFGKQVILKMRQLGIVLDVSHSSEQVVRDVLAFYDAPMVVSHTGFQGHCASERNISDELMQEIAKGGGVIAVGYWEGAVCGITPKDVVAAIAYGLQLVGEDHLALGSDFDGTVTTGFDTSELSALTQEMLNQGFSETQIRKIMGLNMLRILQNQLPAS